jgi:hypothetical protein
MFSHQVISSVVFFSPGQRQTTQQARQARGRFFGFLL